MNEGKAIGEAPPIPITLRGIPDNEEDLATRVGEAVAYIIRQCRTYMDLTLLDGVTVGWNYDDALQAVDLGYASSTTRTYTDTENLIGIAKTIPVIRGEAIRAHIVFNAHQLGSLVDHKDEDYFRAVNLVAHELGHACLIACFEQHSPGKYLEPFRGDSLRRALLDVAHTCWEEYAACRLASVFPHPKVGKEYLKRAVSHSTGVFAKAHEFIESRHIHGDVNRTFLEVCRVVTEAIRMLSYYLGYTEDQVPGTTGEADYEVFGDLSPFVTNLQREMQYAWDTGLEWDGLNSLDGLMNEILKILAAAGMTVKLANGEDHLSSWVDFT